MPKENMLSSFALYDYITIIFYFRVISIKNYKSDVRVIIQILNYHNEEHLFNVPDWNHQLYGDEVICINEVNFSEKFSIFFRRVVFTV